MFHRHARRIMAVALIAGLLALACGGGAIPPSGGSPAATAAPVANEPFVFISTQFKPVNEAEAVRGKILSGFTTAKVDFIPEDSGPFNDRILAEQKTGKGQIGLIGGLHGDFASLAAAGALEDLTALADKLKDRGFPKEFMELGKLGTGKQVYIPWMQATYVLAVNKQALQYLPAGANVESLTYVQLGEWCKNIAEKSGKKRCGFPLGPKGLFHRLVQGYLYPAYTGGLVTTYKSAEAEQMWADFKKIWDNTNPQSTQYEFMQEPLLSGEVWVAFDHVARLVNAFKDKPNDIVGAPAPAGPKGRYYMSVLAGLAIPKTTPNRAGAEKLIDHLTSPDVQAATLREVAFFPVIGKPVAGDLPAHLKAEAEAVTKQSGATDAKVALLPIGLGAKGGEFNKVQQDTVQRILIKGEDIKKVLAEEATNLQRVMNDAKAPCWSPDPPSSGPCQVK